MLVLGVTVGSAVWVTILASGAAIARRAVGVRAIRIADAIAGVGLVGFASRSPTAQAASARSSSTRRVAA
jgi:uncharacterized sodium:solute symporter family permease YidK